MKWLISAILILSASLIPLPAELAVTSYVIAFATLVGGCIGFLFLNSKENIFLRLLVAYSFINVFFSAYPEWSIMGYAQVLLCLAWFLFLIRRPIGDFRAQKDVFIAILLLNIFFMFVQALDKDFALNVGRSDHLVFGTLGNPMILGSFLACMSGLICLKRKWLFMPLLIMCAILYTKGAFISICSGVLFYLFFKIRRKRLYALTILLVAVMTYGYCAWAAHGQLHKNAWSGRLKCWPRVIELWKERPIRGYGLATFKIVYPCNSGDIFAKDHPRDAWQVGNYKGNWVMYLRAHNDWLQILFETGIIGFVLFCGFICSYIIRFIKTPKTDELLVVMSGLVSIAVNMIGAFPLRMERLIPSIIFLLAMLHVLTKKGENNEEGFGNLFTRIRNFSS